MRLDSRMQTIRRLPGAIAHARDKLAVRTGGMQRHTMAIAGDYMAGIDHAIDQNLHPFHRRIDVAHSSAGAGFLAQDMPWFDGLPQLEFDAAMLDGAEVRETEFKMRRKPLELEWVASFIKIIDNIVHVLRDKVRQHETVREFGAPSHQLVAVGALPK